MTRTSPAEPDRRSAAGPLAVRAEAAGLHVVAAAAWPETPDDREPTPVAGFVVSSFSPLAAETATRCLTRRPAADREPVTGVVVVSAFGDLGGALHVAAAVDGGRGVSPLMFFQAVPNAVAGHVAARWGLEGPVVCVADGGVEVASLLIEDGDADEVLVVRVEQGGDRDRAEAVVLRGGTQTRNSEGEVL
jgi:3-oxoacyl-(acyl-carrier-protein) synthase